MLVITCKHDNVCASSIEWRAFTLGSQLGLEITQNRNFNRMGMGMSMGMGMGMVIL
jgi:hypothetical protein